MKRQLRKKENLVGFGEVLMGARAWRSRGIALLSLAFVVLAALPAHADGDPVAIAMNPPAHALRRSADVPEVIVTYDRDLRPISSLEIRNSANVVMPGASSTTGPASLTGGKRQIRFIPSSPLPEDTYTATATAYGWIIPGRQSQSTWPFTVDNTAPMVANITDPIPGELVRAQPMLVRGTGEIGAHVYILENGLTIAEDTISPTGTFATTMPYPPEDGVAHTITARLRDGAGNIGPASAPVFFSHDSVTVVPQILTPAEGSFLASSSVNVSGHAKANTSVTVWEGASAVGSASAGSNGAWATTISFPAGAHTITATSYDGALTDGPSPSRSFTVDLTAPGAPVITAPAPGQALPTRFVTIVGSAEANASIEVRELGNLRATTTADNAGDWTASVSFGEGARTITARAFDRAGNGSATAARSFIVDTAKPAPPVIDAPVQGATLNSTSVTLVGRAEANSSVTILRGAVTVATTATDNAGNWAIVSTFNNGAHTITALAEDAAGNRSDVSLPRSFSVDTVAPAAPTITTPAASAVLITTSVTFTGLAEQATLVTVREGVTPIGTAVTAENGQWTFTVSMPSGAHSVTADATDIAGNISPASAPRSFSVNPGTPDVTPPPAPTITNPTTNDLRAATVTFEGASEAGSQVRIYEGALLLGTATAQGNTQWSFTTTMATGVHNVHAFARDAAGNQSPSSSIVTFTVDATKPVVSIATADLALFLPGTPVYLEGLATDNLGVVSVSLEFRDVLGQLVTTHVAPVCTGCPGLSIQWEDTPTLVPGVYTVNAQAVDVAGNRSVVESIRFITGNV